MSKFTSPKDVLKYSPKKNDKPIKILVGMNTCGIAAGASRVMKRLQEEIQNRGIQDVELKQVGCLGLCYSEPNVEVRVPGLPDVLYGKVDENFATRILENHVTEKQVINENIFDKSFFDILKK